MGRSSRDSLVVLERERDTPIVVLAADDEEDGILLDSPRCRVIVELKVGRCRQLNRRDELNRCEFGETGKVVIKWEMASSLMWCLPVRLDEVDV